MRYVAFLRGINVGGNRKVEMSRLVAICQQMGCTQVRTYINSGNIILDSVLSPDQLEGGLEAGIKQNFGFEVPVVVRTAQSIQDLASAIPRGWTNDVDQKTDVMFLWPTVDLPETLKEIPAKPELETFVYYPGAIVWHVLRPNVTRSGGLKLVGTPLYQQMTIRNINTVRKLAALTQD